jgi:type II secretory pathway pseudopilin PulG
MSIDYIAAVTLVDLAFSTYLFAAEDPLGGWMTVVIQGGALGLLAVLIIYILPREAENNRKEREAREILQNRTLETLQEKFETRNAKIVDAIENQTRTLAKSNTEMAASIHHAVTESIKQAISETWRHTSPSPSTQTRKQLPPGRSSDGG